MTARVRPAITVTKVTGCLPVALDTDGTPLAHGERMIEVEPGVWKAPVVVALEKFLADSLHDTDDSQP